MKLEYVEATQQAAMAVRPYIGMGDKEKIDSVAAEAIQKYMNSLCDFGGRIIISEGVKDEAFHLEAGSLLGCGIAMSVSYDIALDAVDGTTQASKDGPGASSIMVIAEKNTLYSTPIHYIRKLCYSTRLMNGLSVLDSIPVLVSKARYFLEHPPTIIMLDRDRHRADIAEFRKLGCKVKLIQDCDVLACVDVCLENRDADIYYGIGGAPEAVLAASAVKNLDGSLQCNVVGEAAILTECDLVRGDSVFYVTGVTGGGILAGVSERETDSLIITKNGSHRIERAYW